MDLWLYLVLIGLIVIGTTAQRISGMGFALMLAPFLAVLFGPHEGVMLINFFGGISPIIITLQVWHRINWKKFWQLAIPAVPFAIIGIWVTAALSAGVMNVAIGSMVIIGLLIAMFMRSRGTPYDGSAFVYATGGVTGFLNSVAGVGGPPLTAYALISRWQQREFAATIQPLFMLVATIGFLGKLLIDPSQMPELPVWVWVASLVAMFVGILVGTRIEPFIKELHIRNFVIAVSFIGALTALVQGILTLTGVA